MITGLKIANSVDCNGTEPSGFKKRASRPIFFNGFQTKLVNIFDMKTVLYFPGNPTVNISGVSA